MDLALDVDRFITRHSAIIDLRGTDAVRVSGTILTADAMNAHNTFDEPGNVVPVDFDGARLQGNTLTVDLPSKSVVALELR